MAGWNLFAATSIQFQAWICSIRMLYRIREPSHTGESKFKKGPRSIRILSVDNRIVFVLNTAFLPLSLCCANHAPVLLKFHNCIRYIGFPCDNEIAYRQACAIDRQPERKT